MTTLCPQVCFAVNSRLFTQVAVRSQEVPGNYSLNLFSVKCVVLSLESVVQLKYKKCVEYVTISVVSNIFNISYDWKIFYWTLCINLMQIHVQRLLLRNSMKCIKPEESKLPEKSRFFFLLT